MFASDPLSTLKSGSEMMMVSPLSLSLQIGICQFSHELSLPPARLTAFLFYQESQLEHHHPYSGGSISLLRGLFILPTVYCSTQPCLLPLFSSMFYL